MTGDHQLVNYFTRLRPSWHRDAACRDAGVDLFVGRHGSSTATARAICATCPVREECLAEALADPTLVGIWGGTSARERRQMRRRAKKAA